MDYLAHDNHQQNYFSLASIAATSSGVYYCNGSVGLYGMNNFVIIINYCLANLTVYQKKNYISKITVYKKLMFIKNYHFSKIALSKMTVYQKLQFIKNDDL